MEFSECREYHIYLICSPLIQRFPFSHTHKPLVDAAVAQSDPFRRIAFVAAFAMSNYSSTIGRIAKPFNPMLVS
jgi:hypothetical protein